MTEFEELEKVSLEDLGTIIERAKGWKVKVILIGGYAARAYQKESRRLTKDIDIITPYEDLTRFTGLLQSLGYRCRKGSFGELKGEKKINGDSIKIDIIAKEIHDSTTGIHYQLSNETFGNVRVKTIYPFFERNKEIIAQVIDPEELLVLKIMTMRGSDHFDALSILSESELNIKKFIEICDRAKVRRHIRKQVEGLIGDIKKGIVREVWEKTSGIKLSFKKEMRLKTSLKTFYDALSMH